MTAFLTSGNPNHFFDSGFSLRCAIFCSPPMFLATACLAFLALFSRTISAVPLERCQHLGDPVRIARTDRDGNEELHHRRHLLVVAVLRQAERELALAIDDERRLVRLQSPCVVMLSAALTA